MHKGAIKTQLLADQAARWLTIIALVSGALTFIIWLAVGKTLPFDGAHGNRNCHMLPSCAGISRALV